MMQTQCNIHHPARPRRASDAPKQDRALAQRLKNRIPLEDYYLPGDLEAQIKAFVADNNRLRYHEGIGILAPADVHFGRDQTTDDRQSPLAAPSQSRKTSQAR
jgi:hypothetical protein